MGLRKERLGDEIRDIVAEALTGGKMNDPRLQLITITGVKLSSDLQIATIYYRVMDEATMLETQRGLTGAAGYFRKCLADVLEIRRVPAIRFFYDKSIEHGARIEALLVQTKE